MKINSDIYAFIDDDKLKRLIDKNEELKDYITNEIDHMRDEGVIKNCPANGCTGCGRPCGANTSSNTAYFTTALMSIFNYYIPDEIKDAIHLGGSTSVQE